MPLENQCFITGNLARDPEAKYTGNGKPYCKFVVAASHKEKDKEYTEWVPVQVWGPLAEAAGNQLKKGTYVFIQGRYSTRSYEAQDGSRRYVTEVTSNMIALPLSTRSKQERGDFSQFGAPTQQIVQPALNDPYPDGEEIPF